jgi:cyclophilin family peptidyl-prolyl cis-trans isomerase
VTTDPNSPTPPPPTATLSYKQYQSPSQSIDVKKQYFATFKLAKGGEFVAQLYPDKAPVTVNSFVFLAREGFFNGTTFHRVLDGFMAQSGDPTGTGMGGPGYQFKNEDNDLKFDKSGVLAMANAGRDTNGSQFFITFVPTEFLNGNYTIFGQVIKGMDVVNSIDLIVTLLEGTYAITPVDILLINRSDCLSGRNYLLFFLGRFYGTEFPVNQQVINNFQSASKKEWGAE